MNVCEKLEHLDEHDWLQLEMAARGCVSGTSDDWPDLVRAIEKLRGSPLPCRLPAAWLKGFSEGVLEFRDKFPPEGRFNSSFSKGKRNESG
ncbi:MAG: hypothetical protein KatS3mg109_0145 [Pirellulaceae bacterium]|nr:MAG: hypothetical protein KatS3mg109_0145 [Pirellulaceae bacterium]